MADTVVEVTEKVGTPEKEVVEKKVVDEVEDVEDVDDEDSKSSVNGNGEAKLNGSATEKNGDSEQNGDGDAPKNGVAKDSEVVVASKRKSGGGDATDGVITEGASPEKKAKLSVDDAAVEVEANGDAEVVA